MAEYLTNRRNVYKILENKKTSNTWENIKNQNKNRKPANLSKTIVKKQKSQHLCLQSIKPEKEWALKSLKIYIGIRKKLKAPTR